MGAGKDILRILLRKKPSDIGHGEVFERKVSRKCRIRIPAAVFDLPLINTQMLSYDETNVVRKNIDLCPILGIVRLEVFKCGRQQVKNMGVALIGDGFRQQILQFFAVSVTVREEIP